MNSLTVSDIESLRASSAPLPCTVAPPTSADAFKSIPAQQKPASKQLDHHFSTESRTFVGSALKKSASPASQKRIISLGTGRPTPDYYPWESIAFESFPPEAFTSTSQTGGNTPVMQTVRKSDSGYNLGLALNYGHGVGAPHLLRFVTEHIELAHNPPYADWGTCMTAGATSALEIVYRIFCNRGDTILTEEYTYPGAVEGAALLGLRIQGVEMDSEGAIPGSLRQILSTWDSGRGPRPRFLYTIPSGHNPTGATQPLGRRQAMYRIAEEYDLIIIEDDPYYFLRLGSRSSNLQDALDNLVPSYLSLDHSGRVVRLDSTSKILAPGLRAGWVTANRRFIDKFINYHDVSTVAVSGPSQLMLTTLLDHTWGHQGFFTWLDNLSLKYRHRKNVLLDACDKYLPREICSWAEPEYGMFHWINLDWRQHPEFRDWNVGQEVESQLAEIEDRILLCTLLNGVQVTKGSLFHWNKKPVNQIHFRMTFAAAQEADLQEGVKIFADSVRQEFMLQ